MAQFTNQAQLTYKDTVTLSNVAVGEIVEALSITKTALVDTYLQGDTIGYVVSIVNSGSSSYSGLSLSDNLGAYTVNNNILVPLTYTENSLKYYINGILQPSPSVNVANGLSVSPISVPAGGNTTLVYLVSVNSQAPLGQDGSITNTATISGMGITSELSASETITANSSANLSITKTISPVPVYDGGTVTYTFLIENRGALPVVATDNAFITDLFNPILSNITATFNGEAWEEGVQYNYNSTSGLFESVPTYITVPPATFTQDPVSGEWVVTSGQSTLVITGTI